jgi:NifU-like protein involved in Fe-S cluster formation
MNTSEIQEIIRDNYLSPQNFGVPTWKPDAVIDVDNPTCGDSLTLYLKLSDNIIEDISFVAQGCSISIASASLLYSHIVGKELSKDTLISEDEVIKLLGFEPTTSRKNCALLPQFALKKFLNA